MNIVGVSAFYHDAAVALLVGGELVAAAQEERFTRTRYDPAVPKNAFRYCLLEANLNISDIDCVVYYENSQAKLARQLTMEIPQVPPVQREALFRLDTMRPEREIREATGFDGDFMSVSHHEAHAASSFLFSGFSESALFVADAVGEWATTSYGSADPGGLSFFEEVVFPHSLGLLYSALTAYLGFDVNSDEFKVMGLAPYGRPKYLDRISTLVEVRDGGGYDLDQRYFDFGRGRMFTDALPALFGRPARRPDEAVTAFHEDVAASAQVLLQDILVSKVGYLHSQVPSENLCYAGGVALNCVANRVLRERTPFSRIFVFPAAGDAGGAAGAAALAHWRLSGELVPGRLRDARLGPRGNDGDLRQSLEDAAVAFQHFEDDPDGLVQQVALRLAEGEVCGWFQGRLEFGPRALGSRSILADPRRSDMRDHINKLVKKREAFRPFAPAIVADRVHEFFDFADESPFMLDVATVLCPSELPAVSHVDATARLQTVAREVDPLFHSLLEHFGTLTGYPILLNTSFNMRGEPIVRTYFEAIACFVRANLDFLVIGSLLLDRSDIPDSWRRWPTAEGSLRHSGIADRVYTFF